MGPRSPNSAHRAGELETGPQDGPKTSQDGPRWPQDGPNFQLIFRCAEFRVSSLKWRPERAKDRVKRTKGGPKKPKLSTPGGRAGTRAPRRPQDCPKTAPR